MSEIIVSVIMITYNHDKYISKAIENVLNQKTNFDFELIIGEDFSNDDTNIIIKKFYKANPRKIRFFSNNKNIGIIQNEINIIKASRGKYIAFCEGDDYWVDNYKLQKQVNFLDKNSDYGLVHGDVNHLHQNTGKLIKAYNRKNNIVIPDGNILNHLYYPGHIIKTMTTCMRKDILVKYYLNDKDIMSHDWKLIDLSIWFVFARHSKVKYIDEVLSTYRLTSESMSRSQNAKKLYDFHQKIHDILAYFSEKYKASHKIKYDIKIRRIKSELIDSINMKEDNLIIKSFKNLKQNGGRLNNKEKIIYLISRLKFWLRNFF